MNNIEIDKHKVIHIEPQYRICDVKIENAKHSNFLITLGTVSTIVGVIGIFGFIAMITNFYFS